MFIFISTAMSADDAHPTGCFQQATHAFYVVPVADRSPRCCASGMVTLSEVCCCSICAGDINGEMERRRGSFLFALPLTYWPCSVANARVSMLMWLPLGGILFFVSLEICCLIFMAASMLWKLRGGKVQFWFFFATHLLTLFGCRRSRVDFAVVTLGGVLFFVTVEKYCPIFAVAVSRLKWRGVDAALILLRHSPHHSPQLSTLA